MNKQLMRKTDYNQQTHREKKKSEEEDNDEKENVDIDK